MQKLKNPITIRQMAVLGLMTALCFVCTLFLSIKIPVGVGNTMIHMGNAVGLLASLLMGGLWGGLAGGLGMGLSDLLNPMFVMYAPFTFVQKFAMGFLCGKIAFGRPDDKRSFRRNLIGALVGILANIFFAQLNALIVDSLIMGNNWQAVLTANAAKLVSNFLNAVLAVGVAMLLFPPVQKALQQSGLWKKHEETR